VEHFLNSVDLIITKYSTLILEAAILGRCAIAAIFDGEDRFKVFSDLLVLVKSGVELENLLIQLASDSKTFEIWKRDQLSRHKELLPKFYCNKPNSPAALAADAIIKRLQIWRLQSCREN
jgi:CDP-glycerol glycerophosphotransferase (TagB/SpsB family)